MFTRYFGNASCCMGFCICYQDSIGSMREFLLFSLFFVFSFLKVSQFRVQHVYKISSASYILFPLFTIPPMGETSSNASFMCLHLLLLHGHLYTQFIHIAFVNAIARNTSFALAPPEIVHNATAFTATKTCARTHPRSESPS